jgi:type I restriction enzyme, S subunit
MSEDFRTTSFAELTAEGLLEIGDGYRAKLEELGGHGPIFLRAGLLGEHRIDWKSAERFHSRLLPKLRSKLGAPGDTMVTTKGNSVGRTGYVPAYAPEFVYSPHLSYWRSLSPRSLCSRFLYYWSRSPEFEAQLWALAHGTDMAPYLSLVDQGRLRLKLPGIGTQAAIADLLGALDDKIAVNDRIARSCHDLAQAYLIEAHGDAAAAPLAEVAVITMGCSPPGDTYNEKGLGMPFYQGTRDFGDRFPSQRVWCTDPVRVAQRGSTLVSVRAPVGRVNVAREQCCIGRGVASIESRFGVPSVLFHELTAARDVWAPYEAEGTVFGAINKAQMEGLKIPALELSSALRLEEILHPLDERVAAVVAENDSQAALRDVLLPRLMSGEIRVRDAERIVEDAT